MILLESGNRILRETVEGIINADAEEKHDPVEIRLCDFDDVSYRIAIEDGRNNILQISMAAPCLGQILEKGAQAALEAHYGAYVVAAAGGFDVTLEIDLTAITEDKAALVEKLGNMKCNIIGGVFDYYFQALKNKTTPEGPFQFRIRGDTTVYVFPSDDRVVFIYTMDYPDKAENCIAKVFMQELEASKKRIGKAPPVNFSAVPPRELQEQLEIKESNVNLGYISFAILPAHITDDKKRVQVIQLLQDFRTYMQYHIKCSKSYFHSRMRARTVELLKVLSRAKVGEDEDGGKKKVKRTAGGKVWKKG